MTCKTCKSRLSLVATLFIAAQVDAQVYSPIPVSGYTQDVIADAGGNALLTTTTSFDQPPNPPTNWVLYQQGFNTAIPNLGVPASGAIVTSPNRSYQLGPINGNNSLQLSDPGGSSGSPVLSGTLTLVAPERYSALSLLLADGVGKQPSQGGFQEMMTVNWSNGNSTDYAYTVYDWFLLSGTPGMNSGIAIAGIDRATRSTGVPDNNAVNPTLFYYDCDLSTDPNYLVGAQIESVTATRQSGSTGQDFTNIMGLSGAIAVPEPSSLLLIAPAAIFCWCRRVGLNANG